MVDGIYTLANDAVYDQLVALLNSIEVNAGKDLPVCVVAYDDNLEKVQAEIAKRKNVTLLNDPALFKPWEDFSLQVWKTHPHALEYWKQRGISGVRRIGMNRRYCAFDAQAPFEKFIYLDADTLLMGPVDFVFEKLNEVDIAIYDYQYKHPQHIYTLDSPKLAEIFSQDRITNEIFCAGFYASKKGFFDQEQRNWLIARLQEGDGEVLYKNAPNQSVLNYMVMRSELSVHNFIFHLPEKDRAGNSVTAMRFKERDHVLYDGEARLTYLHYIGLSSKLFNQVCMGENITFPYRDLFLHYRYLHEPDQYPKFTGKPKAHDAPPSLATRVVQKTKRALRKIGSAL